MKVYPDSDLNEIKAISHPVFLAVEKRFNEWFDFNTKPGAPMGRDLKEMYEGIDAIYSKKGAIRQAIEEMKYEADDTDGLIALMQVDSQSPGET